VTDVGLVQQSALVEDLAATVARLDEFVLFDQFLICTWADWLQRLHCELLICDIAPLGLVVAEAAGLDSILIENFTWNWIYDGYGLEVPGLQRHRGWSALSGLSPWRPQGQGSGRC
jgi:hypothetical protein